MAGIWTSADGADVHPVGPGSAVTGPVIDDDEHNVFVERYELRPIDPQTNGRQLWAPLSHPHRAAAVVDVGLTHPVAQARVGDAEILGDLRDRLLTQPRELDRALTELRRVRSGHPDILPETTSVASSSMSANPGKAHTVG